MSFTRRALAIAVVLTIATFSPALAQSEPELHDPEKGTLDGSPLDDLPPHITIVTEHGARPDWSPQGGRLLFLDGVPLGDVWTVDVETGATEALTDHFDHQGFTRAQYLSNGDVLLCGPTSGPVPSPERPEAGRFTGVMSVLRAPFDGEPQPLGVPCWEGIATSETSMRIAWNRSDIDYTASDLVDRVVNGVSEIWTGEIRYEEERAQLVDAEMVIERGAVSPVAVLEVQAFRPPDEDELILTAYAHDGGQVLGVDLETGEITDYSQSPVYEEAESVAADGSFVLVERDLESTAIPGPLDIWWLSLDGEATWERLTFFNRYRGGYYASNPAVSPDGQRFAFQLSIDGPVEGQGGGLLVFDLAAVDLPADLAPPAAEVAATTTSSSDGIGGWTIAIVAVVVVALVAVGLAVALWRRRART